MDQNNTALKQASLYLNFIWLFRVCQIATLFGCITSSSIQAHDVKSESQRIYVPVYSSISHFGDQKFDLSVTVSFRNLDLNSSIEIASANYYRTDGKKVKNLLDKPKRLGPLETTQIIIRQNEFRGDIGANLIVEWRSGKPVNPPLIEAVMVGFRGTQAFSFISRGIVLE